jgi:hypothetical protein
MGAWGAEQPNTAIFGPGRKHSENLRREKERVFRENKLVEAEQRRQMVSHPPRDPRPWGLPMKAPQTQDSGMGRSADYGISL